MQPSHSPAATVRVPLLGLGALVIASLAVVTTVRLSGAPPQTMPDAPATATRLLRFEDQPDGSLAVTDASTGRPAGRVEGEAGFVRGTLRGLARERKRAGYGPELPFTLVAHTDGRLTLLDPATGRRVDLESFGPANAGAFARLLRDEPGASRP